MQNNSSSGYSPLCVKTFDDELKSKENLFLRRENVNLYKPASNFEYFRNGANQYSN
jgi:hypothetical protein